MIGDNVIGLMCCWVKPRWVLVSVPHEAIVDLFRVRPTLAFELLASVRAVSPSAQVVGEVHEANLGEVAPPEYRADLVVALSGGVELVVVVEVQLQKNGDKRFAWPVYGAVAGARHRKAAALLVVTMDRGVARWAERPIEVGPGFVLRPIVLGPEQVPVITDVELARLNPEIAVLSVMAHGEEPIGAAIALAAAEVAISLDGGRPKLYLDLILDSLGPVARLALEQVMIQNWQPRSDFIKRLDAEALARGRLEGERLLLLRLLRRRFGDLPAEVEARVAAASAEQVEVWGESFAVCDTLEGVFGG